ncbi:MAG: RNA polymerase sporulation sigma factor SigH [Lachnospiraceae bacterium]|nr:RNA polymerase sporulation sigma factor SigH [Lachnospiraceae bacterium]
MCGYSRMTDEELIRCLRKGEKEITDYIINKYKNLVKEKAKAMFLLGGDNDDLIQEGMIGLFKAIRDYDEQQETSFHHFADLCISRQMYTAIEASKRQKHIPLNSYVSIYEDKDEQPLIDTIQAVKENDPEALFLNKEYVQMIEAELKKNLSEFENKVLYLHLFGMDYQKIAKVLDKTPKSIDNALQRIKGKTEKIVRQKTGR